jgi:predicted house-cleaning noncanonical NTP pyrophosphatase (MazG superfamily)
MRYFKFDKLVRDEIVYQILRNGDLPKYRYLDDKEFIELLKCKLQEEINELRDADSEEKLMEELADVEELVECMLESLGKKYRDLRSLQVKKRKINGSFKKRMYVEYVRCEDSSKWLKYYEKNKEKYPEIAI